MKKALPLFFISFLIVSSSCLTKDNTIAKRFELLFFVQNLGENIVIGSDTVLVTDFKFTLDGISLTNEDSVIIETTSTVSALVYGYNEDVVGDRQVVSSGLGFELNGFTEYKLSLSPVENRSAIFDSDFFGSTNDYSIVIRGKVNGNSFLMRTSPSFTRSFTFDPVYLSDSNETLFVRTFIDLEDVFINSDSEFLNPSRSVNYQAINNRIKDSLDALIFSDSIFF